MNFRFVFLSTISRLFFSQWDLPKLITWSLVNKKKSKSQFKKFSELFSFYVDIYFRGFDILKLIQCLDPYCLRPLKLKLIVPVGTYIFIKERFIILVGEVSKLISTSIFFSIVGSVLEIWFCKVIVEIFAMCK